MFILNERVYLLEFNKYYPCMVLTDMIEWAFYFIFGENVKILLSIIRFLTEVEENKQNLNNNSN